MWRVDFCLVEGGIFQISINIRILKSCKFNSILGGNQNGIHTDNNYANVVGGFHNKIKRGSNYSSILTGDRNLIDYNSQWSSILAGSGNTIYGESGVNHGAIVNGRFKPTILKTFLKS